jgi:hypothetical protein
MKETPVPGPIRLSPALALSAALLCLAAPRARAWDEEGHRIVALVAVHYLDPAVQHKIEALLADDPDPSTAHDIASESVWADTVRPLASNANRAVGGWHDVPMEIGHPDLARACNGRRPLPAGLPASRGPADCAVDKIDQFAAELASDTTPEEEKRLALKYLLNLVGDLHQPVYASDDDNKGGAMLRVEGGGGEPGSLRHYWDADFIDYLGDDPKAIADDLADGVRQSKTFDKMSAGTPEDWAMESFGLARDHAYGKLPPKKPDGSVALPPDYVTDAIETVRLQLARAGVRLAGLLNRALAKTP